LTLANIENVIGSNFDDTLIGDANDNVIDGGFGNDTIDGGDGIDTIAFDVFNQSVTVNLEEGTALSGEDTDTLVNIENVRGSNFDDTLIGDANDNVFRGGLGNDTIDGGDDDVLSGDANANVFDGGAGIDTLSGLAGDDILIGGLGNDTLDGGEGNDTADYSDQ